MTVDRKSCRDIEIRKSRKDRNGFSTHEQIIRLPFFHNEVLSHGRDYQTEIYLCYQLPFLCNPHSSILDDRTGKKASVFLYISSYWFSWEHPYHNRLWGRLFDLSLIVSCGAAGIYNFVDYWNLVFRVGEPNTLDIILGFGTILAILEATRRTVGMPLVIILIVFLLYAFFGYLLPKPLSHRGYTVDRIVSVVFMSNNGIFGLPVAVMCEYIFLFMLFGAFLSLAGVSDLFMDLATSLFGSFAGGPAKVSVLTSALFGTVSGSAVANVTVDGVFNIPLMKKTGFSAPVAAAVEAVTSTGGQLMPPVMGAAAFIMADYLRIPYAKVAKAAVLPAVLYYVSLYAIIHFYALRSGLKGLPREQLPKLGTVLLSSGYLLLPLVLLIYFLGAGYSATTAVLYTIVSVILVSLVNKKHRITFKRAFDGMKDASKASLSITVARRCWGSHRNYPDVRLGNKLSDFIILYPGKLIFTLFHNGGFSILGMGLPTTVCYVLLAVTVAPSIVHMGVQPLAAHLLIFYLGLLSMVTPSAALASYAAAGLARTDHMKAGYIAWWFSLCGYILPYMWIYSPALLLMGSFFEVLQATITATIGVIVLGAGISGYFLHFLVNAQYSLDAILLMVPGTITDLIGRNWGSFLLRSEGAQNKIFCFKAKLN